MNAPCLDLDLHRLDLRFAGARVAEPRAVEQIAHSIESGGSNCPLHRGRDPPVPILEGVERPDSDRRLSAHRRAAPARSRHRACRVLDV